MIQRRFDHIDLRVRNLAQARPFYEKLLPALGFDRLVKIENWLQYERSEPGKISEFFGITESPNHKPNENRIAFWAIDNNEVEHFAKLLPTIGARNLEGPLSEDPG